MYQIDDDLRKKKLAAIKRTFKNLDKTFKEENVAYFIGDSEASHVQRFSSGSVALDAAIGGGVPVGRIIELFGGESSGKSATSLKIIASAQKANLLCAYIDMEHSFDPQWSQVLGVDLSGTSLIVSQPQHLQQAFMIIDSLIDAGVDLIVVDSVASLVPKEELDGEPTKQTIGLIARYMSQFLRRITPKLSRNNCTTIWINQIRDNVGVMYGDTSTTPGGRSLKFYASLRLRLAKGTEGRLKIKTPSGEERQIGLHIKATAVKNKTATPYGKAEYKVFWDGRKTDDIEELADVALNAGAFPRYDAKGELKSNGRNYKWPSEPEFLAKSKAEVAEQLRKFPKVADEIREMLMAGKLIPIEYNEQDSEDISLDNMSEDEFEKMMEQDIQAQQENYSEAEEIETVED